MASKDVKLNFSLEKEKRKMATIRKASTSTREVAKTTTPKAEAPKARAQKAKAERKPIEWRKVFNWILSLLLIIILILGIIWAIGKIRTTAVNQSAINQPVVNQPAVNQPVVNQPAVNQPAVSQPAWVESYTVSPESGKNFQVSFGDWTVVTNDLYSKGDRTQDVTIVIKNISSEIVVVNYAGNNWERGLQIKPGDSQVFSGKAGDFRVTLLEYQNN